MKKITDELALKILTNLSKKIEDKKIITVDKVKEYLIKQIKAEFGEDQPLPQHNAINNVINTLSVNKLDVVLQTEINELKTRK